MVDREDTMDISNQSDSSEDRIVTYVSVVVPIIFGIIFILGVVGNGSVVLIVLRSRRMKTIPNIYILSLALGDFLLILTAVPFSAFVFTFPEWQFGEPLCKLNIYMETFSLGVSVFTLTLLSVDRYLAISRPMKTRSVASIKTTVCRAVSIWIVSLCLAIPDMICSGLKNEVITYCDPYSADWGTFYPRLNVTFRFIVYFAVPIIIVSVCYILIAKKLLRKSSSAFFKNSVRQGQPAILASRTQVAKLVLLLVLVFAICWLPRHIFLFAHHFNLIYFNSFWYIFKICGVCLAFLNSCVNPWALYMKSALFWKYYRTYCCCKSN